MKGKFFINLENRALRRRALKILQSEWPCLHYASFVSARPSSADGAENRVYFILQIFSQTFAAYIRSLCSFDFHP